MSRSRDTDEDLSSLLADVLSADQPDPELLVRYAGDPGSLAAEERARLEAQLAQSPALRDQLRVLQSFELAPAAARPRRSWGARLAAFARHRSTLTLAPLGAVAVLAVVFVYRGTNVRENVMYARRARPESRQLQDEVDRNARAPRPMSKNRAVQNEGDIARFEPPAKPREPAPAGAVSGAREERAAPSRDAKDQLAFADRPAPNAKADVDAGSRPSTGSKVIVTPPVYYAPVPGAAQARGLEHRHLPESADLPEVGQQAGNAPPPADAIALAPPHHAYTAMAQPVLLWFVTQAPPRGAVVELTVSDSRHPDAARHARLPTPSAAGVQRVRLADFGVTLAPATEYLWTVVVHRDPNDPSQDLTTSGRVERVDLPKTIAALRTTAPPGDLPALYARTGLWYEALNAVDDLVQRHPDEVSAQRAFTSLVSQAGIDLPSGAERGDP